MEKRAPRMTFTEGPPERRRPGKAAVLLSGGIDSSTTLAIAEAAGYEVYALSFDYGQRHRIELEAARLVAATAGVKKHLIVSFDLREIGGSALTSDMEVPKMSSEVQKLGGTEESTLKPAVSLLIPVTYVPARNTIFLSFAVAWAEVLEAGDIFIGANAVDYSGYPDCRPEYLRAFESMANLATKVSVEGKLKFAVRAPLISMKKSEIIRKGAELGLDYSLTWSCYDPQRDPEALSVIREGVETSLPAHIMRYGYRPCGLCDSCRIRKKGFKEAGLEDPLLGGGMNGS
jgi:7-cyano-7-deazaguanine synthase